MLRECIERTIHLALTTCALPAAAPACCAIIFCTAAFEPHLFLPSPVAFHLYIITATFALINATFKSSRHGAARGPTGKCALQTDHLPIREQLDLRPFAGMKPSRHVALDPSARWLGKWTPLRKCPEALDRRSMRSIKLLCSGAPIRSHRLIS